MAKWKKLIMFGLVASVALFGAACSNDDDDSSNPQGVIEVFASMSSTTDGASKAAASPISSATVTFSNLKISNGNSNVVTLVDGESSELELLPDPATSLGAFEIPPGAYNCAEGSVEAVSFTLEDGSTCDANMAPFDFGRICVPGAALIVDENSEIAVELELPVISYDCASGDFAFGQVVARPKL